MGIPSNDDVSQTGLAQQLLGVNPDAGIGGLGRLLLQGADLPAVGTIAPQPSTAAVQDGDNKAYVTVNRYDGEQHNPFGHIALSVNGGPSFGLGPDQGMGLLSAVLPVPGIVEPVEAGREPIDQQRIPVTADQAEQVRQYLLKHAGPTAYNLEARNCATFAGDALRSAGIKTPPQHEALTPSALMAGLHQIGTPQPPTLVNTWPTLPKY